MLSLSVYLSESSDTIIDQALSRIEPKLNAIVQQIDDAYFEERGMHMTSLSLAMTKIELTYDFCKSIEQYLQKTDVLVDFEAMFTNRRNTFEVSMTIDRYGQKYWLSTEMITAGGHSIQRLHYRYITRTNAPKVQTDKTKSNELANKLKNLKKHEKLQQEIDRYKERITNAKLQLEVNSKLSDEEIEQINLANAKYVPFPPWSEIVRRGADKNYGYSEAEYDRRREEYRTDQIAFWKNLNIRSHQRFIADVSKTVKKLESKLEQVLKNIA